MQVELRDYQRAALDALRSSLKEEKVNPVVSLPTGSGKTIVICEFAREAVLAGKRVLVLAHVKELLEQAYRSMEKFDSSIDCGLFSAGLNRKDYSARLLIAGIQSISKAISAVMSFGKFDYVIIDEAHLVSENDKSRYKKTLKLIALVNPSVRFIGFTATPYRMKSGLICREDGKTIFNKIVYERTVSSLIDEGYLSPLMSRVVKGEIETRGLHIRRGEFVEREVDALVNKDEMILSACEEIVAKSLEYNRRKVLIFTANIEHAQKVCEKIKELSGEDCELVVGDTTLKQRNELLEKFKSDSLRYIVNVNVLTTGFDNPEIDLVAIIRPTASPGLYYQMAGRGLRKAEGKDYCLLLDFGQNIKRHGPIDDILPPGAPKKRKPKYVVCPTCKLIITKPALRCPWCGTELPKVEPKKKINNRSKTKLTDVSSELDPLAKRGREFFTEAGLENLSELARHFIDYYRAGKFNDQPLTVSGRVDSKMQFEMFRRSVSAKGFLFKAIFYVENFKSSDFANARDFRFELFDYREQLESRLFKNGNYFCTFGAVLDEAVHLSQGVWKNAQQGLFFSTPTKAWSYSPMGLMKYYAEAVQYHVLLTTVLKSLLREHFETRTEMNDFFKVPAVKYFFSGDYNGLRRTALAKINKLLDYF